MAPKKNDPTQDRVLRSEHFIARLDVDAPSLVFWRDGSVGESIEVPVEQVNELAFLLMRFDAEKLTPPVEPTPEEPTA